MLVGPEEVDFITMEVEMEMHQIQLSLIAASPAILPAWEEV